MSWDSYIDNLVGQSRDASGQDHVDSVCIVGIDGGGKWTTDAHPKSLHIEPAECAAIANCFKSKDFSNFQSSGVRIGGQKYQFLREEDKKLVLAKQKEHGAITMQASKTAIVIAHIPEGCQQGNGNKAVGVIAEYLENLNM